MSDESQDFFLGTIYCMETITAASKWLSRRLPIVKSVCVYYHADVDGCVSAAYVAEILGRHACSLQLRKVFTSELDFWFVPSDSNKYDFLIFLDLPAGARFGTWSEQLSADTTIFVYDHHNIGLV